MARLTGLEPKIETVITNRLINDHIMEFKRDVFQGRQYDTVLQLKGWVTVAGDTVNDFAEELNKLIEKYKV